MDSNALSVHREDQIDAAQWFALQHQFNIGHKFQIDRSPKAVVALSASRS